MKKQTAQQIEWITPLEASLEASVRSGVFISPDDIKQLRNRGRIAEEHTQRLSNRLTLYSRQYLLSPELKMPTKRNSPIKAEHVATWLEEYPGRVEALESEGFTIPCKEEAIALIPQRQASRVNLGGRRKTSL